jgi:hypothetical protein
VDHGAGYIDRTALPTTGTYTVLVDPAGSTTGSVRLQLIAPADQTGTIAVNGASATATLSVPGSVARYSFTAMAGQRVQMNYAGNTLNDCTAFKVLDATGKVLDYECIRSGTSSTDTVTLPTAGTYTAVIDPAGSDVGVVTLRVVSA